MNWQESKAEMWPRALVLAAAVALSIGCGAARAAATTDGCAGDPVMPDHVALVIGVSDYGQSERISGVKDARDMACSLQKLGFTVIGPLTDPDITAINDGIETFGKSLRDVNAKVALFYFSGHGVQQDLENYLVPKGADYTRTGLLALSQVFRKLGEMASGTTKIVLLDACRNADAIRIDGKPPAKPGLAQITKGTGGNIIIELATLYDQSAASGPADGNSPFTAVLLSHLLEPGLSLRDLLDTVAREVRGQGKQSPWVEGGDFGNGFYLRRPVTAQVVIDHADDDLQILQHGHEILTLKDKPQNAQATLTLKAGDNPIEVRVFNERTYRNHHPWESAEGWNYALELRGSAGNRLGQPFSDGEDAVYKDGPHFGKWFTVATANLYVYPAAPVATLELRDQKIDLARHGDPQYEFDQAYLCKIMVLPAIPVLRPDRESLLLVGGARSLRAKAQKCFSGGVSLQLVRLLGQEVLGHDQASATAAVSSLSGDCAGDHLWYVVEDHTPGELQDVPNCG